MFALQNSDTPTKRVYFGDVYTGVLPRGSLTDYPLYHGVRTTGGLALHNGRSGASESTRYSTDGGTNWHNTTGIGAYSSRFMIPDRRGHLVYQWDGHNGVGTGDSIRYSDSVVPSWSSFTIEKSVNDEKMNNFSAKPNATIWVNGSRFSFDGGRNWVASTGSGGAGSLCRWVGVNGEGYDAWMGTLKDEGSAGKGYFAFTDDYGNSWYESRGIQSVFASGEGISSWTVGFDAGYIEAY
jgi:hypothetical protein